ncbi:MAG: zinc-ribbon domain-containing protein [Lachnospiraceae bacterium]|nr:zinc-ribbon domain-containing protein [Lachnospiraceae bacterium]
MVNCRKCGAPLSLDQAYCPYCGEPNPEAQEHLKKLQEMNEQFENASREVAAEVKKSRKGYGILVILVMLLLSNLVVFVMHAKSYDIAERVIASKMTESEIKARLDQYLEEGGYMEMALFMNKFSLSYRDYEDYSRIAWLADLQNRMTDSVTRYLFSTDPYEDPLVSTCRAIADYEEEYARLNKRDVSETVRIHAEKINGEVNGFLRNFLGLTEQDIAGIKDMNESALLILVNERLNNEK